MGEHYHRGMVEEDVFPLFPLLIRMLRLGKGFAEIFQGSAAGGQMQQDGTESSLRPGKDLFVKAQGHISQLHDLIRGG